MLHKMYSKNNSLRELYSIELDKCNSILGNEQSEIIERTESYERRLCLIPFYYINRCFNL